MNPQNPPDNIERTLSRLLGRKWIDKPIALIAIVPWLYAIWKNVGDGDVDVPQLTVTIELLLVAATMVMRRPPVRVTANPLWWLLALVATYWTFLTAGLYETGSVLTAEWIPDAAAIVSLAIALWARLSLGRNIGYVPAERKIVTTGAYRYVRHPIYTALFLGIIAVNIEYFSWRNVGLDTVCCALWIIKTFVEERFLRRNSEYVSYMGTVKWRWVPGVA